MIIIIYHHTEKLQDEVKALTTESRWADPFALGHPNCEGQVILEAILSPYRVLCTNKAMSALWRGLFPERTESVLSLQVSEDRLHCCASWCTHPLCWCEGLLLITLDSHPATVGAARATRYTSTCTSLETAMSSAATKA